MIIIEIAVGIVVGVVILNMLPVIGCFMFFIFGLIAFSFLKVLETVGKVFDFIKFKPNRKPYKEKV